MALFTHTLAARMLVTRDDPKDHDEGECELLGSFALLVQAALGLLALSSLVYKRWRERPQRPVKIWFFDVSKQVVGSVLVHIANLVLALLSSGKFDTTPHPSRLTTVGIAILIYSLRAITYLCELLPPDNPFSYGITSGDYGSPPKASSWIKQSVLYFAGLMFMKLIVAILFAIFPIALGKFGDFLLGWTEGNRRVQIAFVMFIFPLIMNAVQYYIIDIFIKKQETKAPHLDDEERLPIARSDDSDDDDSELGIPHDSNLPQVQPGSGAAAAAAGGAIGKGDKRQKVQSRTRSFEDSSYVYSTDEDDEHAIIAQKQKRGHSKKGSTSARIEEYDPDIDGDNTAAKR
ncbi:hypothetical protein TWF679_008461 [Orbilia oligospora]|uniref:Vacuolar membrane protein n=1 Tax=Orbilia oligospora TaxID=2813651 RepID=A0A8H8V4Z0_ORBOL|nr:hypothetical protein TWF679_008461 [Orbilia oligospora]